MGLLQLCALFCLLCSVFGHNRFQVSYEWSYFNFTWESEEQLRNAMSTGKYIPDNVIISGIKYYDKKFYFTLPRMKDGVPATLATIFSDSHNNDTEPLLQPFPNWDMNEQGNCDAIQNVQNIEIDTEGKIWILDGGRTNTLTRVPNTKCPPRLIIYDIPTNQVVKNYIFPEEITKNGCYLYDIVIDDSDGGYAYITDNSGVDPGLIVYSLKENRAWKHRDESMHASRDAVEFRVSGIALSAPINIAGIALGPKVIQKLVGSDQKVSEDRLLYFSPLSSLNLFATKTSILKNDQKKDISTDIKNLGRKSSQTDGMVMDENGVLYYGLLTDNSIAKWDSKMPFTSAQRVIARDPTYIQWPDSLAFDMDGNLLVVTNRLQKFIYGQLNLSEANFRILSANLGVRSYLYGTPIEIPADSTPTPVVSVPTGKTSEEEFDQKKTHYSIVEPPKEETESVEPVNEFSSASCFKTNSIVFLTSLSVFWLK